MLARNSMILMMFFLQACSAFPQLVRHSDPLSADDHVRLGAAYEAQGQKDLAARQYSSAVRLQKNNIPALIALGNLAFNRGDMKQAESRYKKVLTFDAHHAGANNNLAMISLARGTDLKAAEQFALAALKQDGPMKPYALETLATIYIQQNRPMDARKALDDADAAASPDDHALREQLSMTRKKMEAL